MRVLLVEDDQLLAVALRTELTQLYAVDSSRSAAEARYRINTAAYDLLILDLGLPDGSGINLCRFLRQAAFTLPILVLTADVRLESKVEALDSGADDYLTKPFSFPELCARSRALLRRPAQNLPTILSLDTLRLDSICRSVTRDGQPILLRRKEFDLLEYLLRNCGHVLTREMIYDHVWDEAVDPFSNTVDVHIKHLRDRVDRPYAKPLIHTVKGIGYVVRSTTEN